ncbi:hypothetical protein [Paenibacillus roseipurpureus]|uniref:Uncharacterized protein n=1 Tax=Paenibacillus roseopurpureus TaxID=2918901 RepID=A0AA96LLC2_9BACL|nr:hypothetical protein [Paenibacillus sp. MBLB1832]WNR43118.1 hypothetical protein MJB10_18635 [Paenibacillus sp. MBLB1832]
MIDKGEISVSKKDKVTQVDATYHRLVTLNDELTEATLLNQILDPLSKYYGGIQDETGIARANHMSTPRMIAGWACALVNPDSRYYHDPYLLGALDKAAAFMLNRQHADGTISLGSTNYNSPPDTAFVVGGVTQIYQLLNRHDWAEAAPVAAKLGLFLERTIPAMLTGGCHTPNHRWVITAALCLLHEIFPLQELLERAEDWLAEGLDITADGEWTERSNGIYNAVSDIALFHTGRLMNRPELMEAVRRNLRMMMYLIHPSGEVVTDYSGRQDFGQTFTMANYFPVYRLMAAHDKDPVFAAMADYAASFLTGFHEGVNNHPLMSVLVYPEADISQLERAPLLDRYVKVLNAQHPIKEHLEQIGEVGHNMKIEHSSMHLAYGAPVVRIRELEQSVTIMPLTPSFFSLRHGKARLLGIKLATSFSPGIVKFDHLTANESVYTLGTVLEKGYNGPIPRHLLPESKEGSPWYLLPHQHRAMTHLQKLALQVEITAGAADSEWTIRVKSDEREDVFAQLTFIFGNEGRLSGDDIIKGEDGKYFFKSGSMQYDVDGDVLEITSGAYEHLLPMVREDQHPSGCQYVHVNLVTPYDRTFKIRLLSKGNSL